MTDEEVDRIFQKTDYDQDGYITAEDFYAVIAQREGVYEWCLSKPFEKIFVYDYGLLVI